MAAAKVEELIAELQGCGPRPYEPAVQRIVDGFTHFKINNFEYTLTYILTLHYYASLLIISLFDSDIFYYDILCNLIRFMHASFSYIWQQELGSVQPTC